jgi:hypothetical protein
MENIIDCTICMEKYNSNNKIPRILSCGHTYCTQCLEKIASTELRNKGINCPLDKTLGHPNKNVKEIPINRLIIDFIDINSKKKDSQKIKSSNYLITAKEKIKKLTEMYNQSLVTIKECLNNLLIEKDNCFAEIENYYTNIIQKLFQKKEYLENILNIYTNEKINFYSDMISQLEKNTQLGNNGLKKIDMITKEKNKNNISVAEELNLVTSLGFETLEDNSFLKYLNLTLNEINGGVFPHIIYSENDQLRMTNYIHLVVEYIKLNIEEMDNNNLFNQRVDNIISNQKRNPLQNNIKNNDSEIFKKIANESSSFSSIISDNITKFLWFEQNSINIYSYDLTKKNLKGENKNKNWKKEHNNNSFKLPEMFRVTQLSNNNAFITGGLENMNCLSNTFLYSKGDFIRKSNMFFERRNHSSIKVNNFIYVCGGIDLNNNPMSQCEKYSFQLEEWSRISNMVKEKSHISLCSINNKYIFSFGGENKINGILDTIERYTILNDTWDILNINLPLKIECASCIKKNDKEILIIGGFSSSYGPVDYIINFNFHEIKLELNENKLQNAGWSIYMPILYNEKDKNEKYIIVALGGEENIEPNLIKLKID